MKLEKVIEFRKYSGCRQNTFADGIDGFLIIVPLFSNPDQAAMPLSSVPAKLQEQFIERIATFGGKL